MTTTSREASELRGARPRPPRVAYLGHSAAMSGAEISLLRLLEAIDDVDPVVVLAEHGPLVDRLVAAGVPTRVIPLGRGAASVRRTHVVGRALQGRAVSATLAYTALLALELRRIAPDVIHTNSMKAHLYGGLAAALLGVPHVWHARDRAAPDYLPSATVRIVRTAARVLPTVVVANSQSTLETYPGVRSSEVIANGVPAPATTAIARRRPPPLRIGIVGRIAPWKGQDLFLRAFAAGFAGGPERAVVVGGAMFGEHAYEAELRRLGERLGIADQLEFVGFTDDVASQLSELHVLVHCSTIPEPFGQVIVEGMASGLPVVASDAGGPAEIVEQGRTGLLVPPGDVHALTLTLMALARDDGLRERLGRAAIEASGEWSPARCAARMTDVYGRLVSSRTPARALSQSRRRRTDP